MHSSTASTTYMIICKILLKGYNMLTYVYGILLCASLYYHYLITKVLLWRYFVNILTGSNSRCSHVMLNMSVTFADTQNTIIISWSKGICEFVTILFFCKKSVRIHVGLKIFAIYSIYHALLHSSSSIYKTWEKYSGFKIFLLEKKRFFR